MFGIMKMTHVRQYWRSTLTAYSHLWSSIFDHKDLVATCLERSQWIPLVVHLDLKHGDYHHHPECIFCGSGGCSSNHHLRLFIQPTRLVYHPRTTIGAGGEVAVGDMVDRTVPPRRR